MTTETIYQSIVNVSAGIGAIGKDQKADMGTYRYQFRGIDDVLDALHPVLIECGVTITPQVVDVLTISDGVLLTIDYLIANVYGDEVTATFVGEGRDKGDKAAQKAQSNAYKYMAFQTFCIPVAVDDSDSDQYVRTDPETLPVGLSAAEKRMKTIKDHAWKLTGHDVDESKAFVEQSIAVFGGEPKNKSEVEVILANMDEVYGDTDER